MKFSQVRLLVDDFGPAFRFYRDELGLAVRMGEEEGPYASFDAGAVAIFDRAGQQQALELRAPGDSTLMVLEVDDVDSVAARLGDNVVGQPQDQPHWGGRVAYVRDPAGNLLELFEPIPMTE